MEEKFIHYCLNITNKLIVLKLGFFMNYFIFTPLGEEIMNIFNFFFYTISKMMCFPYPKHDNCFQ